LGDIAANASVLLRASSALERVGGGLDDLGCDDGEIEDGDNGGKSDLSFRNGNAENTGLGDDKGFCVTV
jgi:hypothetical protein